MCLHEQLCAHTECVQNVLYLPDWPEAVDAGHAESCSEHRRKGRERAINLTYSRELAKCGKGRQPDQTSTLLKAQSI